ncbi:MAG: homoserine O-succinyltransferase [Bacteroidales bacterium OttesenSCG-928-I14]|jgi:homoserine O-succinyltransferase|nr:homoserine O-succinyltransferase [Bacteroidales bacterium OttesenSCG-928-I14]
MPLNLPRHLPAIEILKRESIFVMDDLRASAQDIRPLKIVLLNLMPVKIATETDFVRLLSDSPLQVNVVFVKMKEHQSKNTSLEHLMAFYKNFEDICEENYDGMIITGAPLELMNFEEVTYWDELQKIFDWASKHVTSTLYICWAAQAGLYHFYGIPKYSLAKKMFGVFQHTTNGSNVPLFRGFDSEFYVPHSRYTEIRKEDILKVPRLKLLVESKESGVHIVSARCGREIFMTGHAEYAPNTLHNEYQRDLDKGIQTEIPKNYYKDNDSTKDVLVSWVAHANLLFKNWLNYYVYQATPYDPKEIEFLEDLNVKE